MRKGILAAATVLALTGCGSTVAGAPVYTATVTAPPSTSPASPAAPSSTPASSPVTPTQTASKSAPTLSDSWTDSDGYSYNFVLQTTSGTAKKDVANAKPGMADITWEYTVTGSITNTTPQRNSPVPNVATGPLWPATSAVCTSGGFTQPAFNTLTPLDNKWCTLSNTPFRFDVKGQTIGINGTLPALAQGSNMVSFTVPEGQADAVIAELKSPVVWELGRGEGKDLSGRCLMNTGIYLTQATAATGCK